MTILAICQNIGAQFLLYNDTILKFGPSKVGLSDSPLYWLTLSSNIYGVLSKFIQSHRPSLIQD